MSNQRCRKSEIAKELYKSQSSIARELNRYHIFKPHTALKSYEYTLKDSKQGINLNTFDLTELSHIICPLVKNTVNL